MNSGQKRLFILCVDGLSLSCCDDFTSLLPNCAKLLANYDSIELDTGVLSTAHAAWAELLTGQPWYLNGCVGLAYPHQSLNKLIVLQERDLLSPVTLIDATNCHPGGLDIVVNVPILEPRANRIWLSEGSLPTARSVAPSKIASVEPFSQYKSRPIIDLVSHPYSLKELCEVSVEAEEIRLACASDLMKHQSWSNFIYRLSIFDLFSHFIGINFLRAHDLIIHESLKRFMLSLDNCLRLLLEQEDVLVAVVSTFSHTACLRIGNINQILARAGWLQMTEEDASEENDKRREATGSICIAAPIKPGVDSMEGRLDLSRTQAASPLQGAVFVNRIDHFTDGLLSVEDAKELTRAIGSFLKSTLASHGIEGIRVEENPKISSFDSAAGARIPVPELMVCAPGVEFHNMTGVGRTTYNVPRTTHKPGGFLLLPQGVYSGQKIVSSSVKDVLHGAIRKP